MSTKKKPTKTKKSGAAFSRGESKQDYSTPREFFEAMARAFGLAKFDFDLAASPENAKAERYFTEARNSLEQDWTELKGILWLNPPYDRIAPWAAKCAASADPLQDRLIYLLVPASVGSNWYAQHVHNRAHVYFLNGRLRFNGHKNYYPKDLLLAVYGAHSSYSIWDWRKSSTKHTLR